ncbi:MAG: M20 family metallo-hydrolase [Proteobacteria bacterium]|nr:M20 family metallo-hydrolase [Pseudomonadota bacterium]MBU1610490.1 M20 family metallo-hydrolase [Pseudomonadota bacterium]
MLDRIFAHIEASQDYLVELQRQLVAIPALGPRNGGDGEKEKADWFKGHLTSLGFTDIIEMNAPDSDVSCGYRPNLAVILPGIDTTQTFWIISHLDIVPPGDLSLWNANPYELQVNGDIITGRGVEDNHQGLVSSMMLAKALLDLDITPSMNLGLMFVADEETGSHKGLSYIAKHHADIFSENDLILVPDFGESSGELVEIAEKSMMWLRVIVDGKQCHASTPEQGVNTLVAASDLIMKTRKLYDIYDNSNSLFCPAHSTFEATMKEANVANINTLPGRDVFYVDCRIMAEYDLDEVLETFQGMGREVEQSWGVRVRFETVQREQAAPPTEEESPIVQATIKAIKAVYGNAPRPVGVGGGTVAAFLRRKGLPVVVWATLDHQAHQPNETSSIAHTVGDAKVMALVLMNN